MLQKANSLHFFFVGNSIPNLVVPDVITQITTALRASDNDHVSRSLPMSRTDSPVPHQCSTDRAAGARSPDGNCAQCSNENTGLRAIVSNIERKKFALNVRHHFHCPASFHATGHFAKEKR